MVLASICSAVSSLDSNCKLYVAGARKLKWKQVGDNHEISKDKFQAPIPKFDPKVNRENIYTIMTKKPLYLIVISFLTSVATALCAGDVIAQSQVNVTHFVNRTSRNETPVRQDDSLCSVDRSKSDQFFIINEGVDIDVKYDDLDKQMKLWDSQLEKVDENLDPELCCYTATYIRTLRDRVAAILEWKRKKAVSEFGPNSSAELTAEFKKLNTYYKQLNNRANMFFAVNRIHGNPKWYYRFFPARRREEAAVVYQKYGASLTQVGTNIAIYGWENKGTINPEIVSTFFGPFRFAVNTLLTSVDGDSANITEAAQLRTLTGNGGNLVASFYYPIHHYSNSWLTSLLQFSPKFATELPILNSPFKGRNVYANGNIGVDLSVNARLGAILGGASLFVYARPSWVIASDAYRDALQVGGNFWLLQPVAGIDIPYLGKIAFNFPVVSDVKSLTTDSYLLSFTVSPQNLIDK